MYLYEIKDRGRRKLLFRYVVVYDGIVQQYFAWKRTAKRYIRQDKERHRLGVAYDNVVWKE